MSIDVEALNHAMRWAAHSDGHHSGSKTPRLYAGPKTAAKVAAEYARLVPAEDEGLLPCTCRPFFDAHVTGHPDCPRGHAEDEGPWVVGCTCTPELNDAACPVHFPAEDEGRLREAWRSGYIVAASQFTTWGEEAIEMEADRQYARLVPAEDEGRLRNPYTERGEHKRQSLAGTHNFDPHCPFCFYDHFAAEERAALAATPEPR